VDAELQEVIDKARTPLLKPRTSKRSCVERTWRVQCVGNPLVVYECKGTLQPNFCPACGGQILIVDFV
jgi:rRNA maturation endonuclease Nob1